MKGRKNEAKKLGRRSKSGSGSRIRRSKHFTAAELIVLAQAPLELRRRYIRKSLRS